MSINERDESYRLRVSDALARLVWYGDCAWSLWSLRGLGGHRCDNAGRSTAGLVSGWGQHGCSTLCPTPCLSCAGAGADYGCRSCRVLCAEWRGPRVLAPRSGRPGERPSASGAFNFQGRRRVSMKEMYLKTQFMHYLAC